MIVGGMPRWHYDGSSRRRRQRTARLSVEAVTTSTIRGDAHACREDCEEKNRKNDEEERHGCHE
jgi:hypothetical protein